LGFLTFVNADLYYTVCPTASCTAGNLAWGEPITLGILNTVTGVVNTVDTLPTFGTVVNTVSPGFGLQIQQITINGRLPVISIHYDESGFYVAVPDNDEVTFGAVIRRFPLQKSGAPNLGQWSDISVPFSGLVGLTGDCETLYGWNYGSNQGSSELKTVNFQKATTQSLWGITDNWQPQALAWNVTDGTLWDYFATTSIPTLEPSSASFHINLNQQARTTRTYKLQATGLNSFPAGFTYLEVNDGFEISDDTDIFHVYSTLSSPYVPYPYSCSGSTVIPTTTTIAISTININSPNSPTTVPVVQPTAPAFCFPLAPTTSRCQLDEKSRKGKGKQAVEGITEDLEKGASSSSTVIVIAAVCGGAFIGAAAVVALILLRKRTPLAGYASLN